MGNISLTGTFTNDQLYSLPPRLDGRQIALMEMAARAMQGMMTRLDAGIVSEEEMAEKSFRVAEAMVAEAAKKGIYP